MKYNQRKIRSAILWSCSSTMADLVLSWNSTEGYTHMHVNSFPLKIYNIFIHNLLYCPMRLIQRQHVPLTVKFFWNQLYLWLCWNIYECTKSIKNLKIEKYSAAEDKDLLSEKSIYYSCTKNAQIYQNTHHHLSLLSVNGMYALWCGKISTIK